MYTWYKLHEVGLYITCDWAFVLQLVTYAPFTLFPTAVPRAVFEQALAVQTHYNLLVDKISQDTQFLEESLAR